MYTCILSRVSCVVVDACLRRTWKLCRNLLRSPPQIHFQQLTNVTCTIRPISPPTTLTTQNAHTLHNHTPQTSTRANIETTTPTHSASSPHPHGAQPWATPTTTNTTPAPPTYLAMASPPHHPSFSPPSTTLSLPKKRPSLTLPTAPPPKRRKPSTASSTHPLRQTSFPPAGGDDTNALYSPTSSVAGSVAPSMRRRSESLDVDDEIASSVAGSRAGTLEGVTLGGGKKGGRGKKAKGEKRLGRPPKNRNEGSVIDDSTTTTRKGTTAATAAGEDEDSAEEEEEGEDEAGAQMESGKLTRELFTADKERRALFQTTVPPAHQNLYAAFAAAKLKTEVVRRLTNQTLSQSVPASVVTTINSYTKLFVGELVGRALQVQEEWVAAAEKLATEEANPTFGREAEGEAKVAERDRGPLVPDHLREALRRYKRDREGGTVGFTGLSLEGRERAAVRGGGRRLFR